MFSVSGKHRHSSLVAYNYYTQTEIETELEDDEDDDGVVGCK